MSQDQKDALYPAYVKMAAAPANFCISPLARLERRVLYTDTINGGQQSMRDDLWAVSTEELNDLERRAALAAPAVQVIDAPRVEVPRTITEAMHEAAVRAIHRATGNDDAPRLVWDAMLAAAPALPIARQAQPTDRDARFIGVWNDALEEAALICDGVNSHDNPMTAGDCADAIRALKSEQKG